MKSREPGIYRDPSATGAATIQTETAPLAVASQSRIASAIARGFSCSESAAKSRLRVETLSSPARRPQRLWQKPITHPYLLVQSAARSTPAQGENHAMRERQF